MIGQHIVTVSSERAADVFGLPINVNPYFEFDASGWTVTGGGSGWAAGSVEGGMIDQAVGSRAPYVYKQGVQYRIRAVVTCTGSRWVHVSLCYLLASGQIATDSITFKLSAGTYVIENVWTPQNNTLTHTQVWARITGWLPNYSSQALVRLGSVELNRYDPSAAVATPVDISCLVDEVAIQHGRDDPTGQPEASSATVDMSWNADTDGVPPEVEVGARVEVSTRYPTDWARYEWTGTADASTSTKTDDDGVTTNRIRNPTFRNDLGLWLVSPAVGSAHYNNAVRVASGGVDDAAFMRATTKITPLPPPAPLSMTNSSFAEVGIAGAAIAVGDVVTCSFWAQPYGNTPGLAVQAQAVSPLYETVLTAPFVGSGWQRFTFSYVSKAAVAGPLLRFTYRTEDAAAIAIGDGWNLDRVLVTVNSPGGSLDYFDGSTPSVEQSLYTRFVGRVTDIAYGWDDAGENTPTSPIGQLVCVGYLADLGRRVVGAEPFPQELDGARVSRVLALAGTMLNPATSDPGRVQILPRDIDSQPALDVAHATADSGGGVIWATRDGETRYADAEHRRNTTAKLELDACDVLVTPTWRRNTDGLVNKVSLGYGATPEGGEQPRYVDGNAASVTKFGEYAYTAETELAALADAQARGSLMLLRNSQPVWVMSALPIDVRNLDDARTAIFLGLDMHDLISLTGLPAIDGAPTSAVLWVEGWTEHLAWGVHAFEVNVSGYCRTAPPPRWDDVPTTWDETAGTWDDMACLGPVVPSGRWTDVPATQRWNDVPSGTTWDTYV